MQCPGRKALHEKVQNEAVAGKEQRAVVARCVCTAPRPVCFCQPVTTHQIMFAERSLLGEKGWRKNE